MMDPANDLESFTGFFQRVERRDESLLLRFYRGFTFEESDQAVLLVQLDDCEQIDTVESTFAALAGEEVDGVEIERRDDRYRVEVDFCWVHSGKSVPISARQVAVRSEAYSLEDYRQEIRGLRKALQTTEQKSSHQTDQLRRLRRRLREDIHRGQKKAAFFASRDDPRAAAQAAVVDSLTGIVAALAELDDVPDL